MSLQNIDAKVAGWLAEVAAAITPVSQFESGYGVFYVNGVSFGFEGEDMWCRLVPNDGGGFDIHIGPEEAAS